MDEPFLDTVSLPMRLAPRVATLDAGECAALLRCSRATVEELAVRGEIPATRFGRGWVFVTEQILTYLKARCERDAFERRNRLEAAQASTARVARAPDGLVRPRPGRPRKAISPLD